MGVNGRKDSREEIWRRDGVSTIQKAVHSLSEKRETKTTDQSQKHADRRPARDSRQDQKDKTHKEQTRTMLVYEDVISGK